MVQMTQVHLIKFERSAFYDRGCKRES